jgi:hypothetical protein
MSFSVVVTFRASTLRGYEIYMRLSIPAFEWSLPSASFSFQLAYLSYSTYYLVQVEQMKSWMSYECIRYFLQQYIAVHTICTYVI